MSAEGSIHSADLRCSGAAPFRTSSSVGRRSSHRSGVAPAPEYDSEHAVDLAVLPDPAMVPSNFVDDPSSPVGGAGTPLNASLPHAPSHASTPVPASHPATRAPYPAAPPAGGARRPPPGAYASPPRPPGRGNLPRASPAAPPLHPSAAVLQGPAGQWALVDELRSQLAALEAQLAEREGVAHATQAHLLHTDAELRERRGQLCRAEAELAELRQELQSRDQELRDSQDQWSQRDRDEQRQWTELSAQQQRMVGEAAWRDEALARSDIELGEQRAVVAAAADMARGAALLQHRAAERRRRRGRHLAGTWDAARDLSLPASMGLPTRAGSLAAWKAPERWSQLQHWSRLAQWGARRRSQRRAEKLYLQLALVRVYHETLQPVRACYLSKWLMWLCARRQDAAAAVQQELADTGDQLATQQHVSEQLRGDVARLSEKLLVSHEMSAAAAREAAERELRLQAESRAAHERADELQLAVDAKTQQLRQTELRAARELRDAEQRAVEERAALEAECRDFRAVRASLEERVREHKEDAQRLQQQVGELQVAMQSANQRAADRAGEMAEMAAAHAAEREAAENQLAVFAQREREQQLEITQLSQWQQPQTAQGAWGRRDAPVARSAKRSLIMSTARVLFDQAGLGSARQARRVYLALQTRAAMRKAEERAERKWVGQTQALFGHLCPWDPADAPGAATPRAAAEESCFRAMVRARELCDAAEAHRARADAACAELAATADELRRSRGEVGLRDARLRLVEDTIHASRAAEEEMRATADELTRRLQSNARSVQRLQMERSKDRHAERIRTSSGPLTRRSTGARAPTAGSVSSAEAPRRTATRSSAVPHVPRTPPPATPQNSEAKAAARRRSPAGRPPGPRKPWSPPPRTSSGNLGSGLGGSPLRASPPGGAHGDVTDTLPVGQHPPTATAAAGAHRGADARQWGDAPPAAPPSPSPAPALFAPAAPPAGGGAQVVHAVSFSAAELGGGAGGDEYRYSAALELQQYCFRLSYKLCSRGDHVGVWFVPRQGPRDAGLRWPMPHGVRVEATLGGATLAAAVFGGAAFAEWLSRHPRPGADATAGYGRSAFVPHAALAGADCFVIRATLLSAEEADLPAGGGGEHASVA